MQEDGHKQLYPVLGVQSMEQHHSPAHMQGHHGISRKGCNGGVALIREGARHVRGIVLEK